MYMGVVAPKGNHKIEYSYVTPDWGLEVLYLWQGGLLQYRYL